MQVKIKPLPLNAILYTNISTTGPITFGIKSEEDFIELCENFPKLTSAGLFDPNTSSFIRNWKPE